MVIFGVIVGLDRAARDDQQKILTQGKTAPQEIDAFCLVGDGCMLLLVGTSVF